MVHTVKAETENKPVRKELQPVDEVRAENVLLSLQVQDAMRRIRSAIGEVPGESLSEGVARLIEKLQDERTARLLADGRAP